MIVRHHTEQFRSSNSGRLANLALPNSEIIEYGDAHDGRSDPAKLVFPDGAWLLFPAGDMTEVAPDPPPRHLIVLDATWAQARKMYRKLDGLRGVPILRLPDEAMPVARLRQSPGVGRVSTIEAIARALRMLEGEEPAAGLERLFAIAVERSYATGRRRLPS